MKTRTFIAQATMSIDMEQEFELTEAEYEQAIEEYGDIWTYAKEIISPNGGFTEIPNSGDWAMYDASELTKENENV